MPGGSHVFFSGRLTVPYILHPDDLYMVVAGGIIVPVRPRPTKDYDCFEPVTSFYDSCAAWHIRPVAVAACRCDRGDAAGRSPGP